MAVKHDDGKRLLLVLRDDAPKLSRLCISRRLNWWSRSLVIYSTCSLQFAVVSYELNFPIPNQSLLYCHFMSLTRLPADWFSFHFLARTPNTS